MISSLRGVVVHAGADSVVIEIGGVGYSVAVPTDLARTARVGESLALHTSLIVREDSLSLYGFASREELELFTLLIGVTGVGPKSALGVLSHLSVDEIATAVIDDDDAPFRRVSGIGPKTAKLIVVQLAGRLAPPATPAAPTEAASGAIGAQVIQALVGLGWPERTAAEAVATTSTASPDAETATVAALLRRTLATLGPTRAGSGRG